MQRTAFKGSMIMQRTAFKGSIIMHAYSFQRQYHYACVQLVKTVSSACVQLVHMSLANAMHQKALGAGTYVTRIDAPQTHKLL